MTPDIRCPAGRSRPQGLCFANEFVYKKPLFYFKRPPFDFGRVYEARSLSKARKYDTLLALRFGNFHFEVEYATLLAIRFSNSLRGSITMLLYLHSGLIFEFNRLVDHAPEPFVLLRKFLLRNDTFYTSSAAESKPYVQ